MKADYIHEICEYRLHGILNNIYQSFVLVLSLHCTICGDKCE